MEQQNLVQNLNGRIHGAPLGKLVRQGEFFIDRAVVVSGLEQQIAELVAQLRGAPDFATERLNTVTDHLDGVMGVAGCAVTFRFFDESPHGAVSVLLGEVLHAVLVERVQVVVGEFEDLVDRLHRLHRLFEGSLRDGRCPRRVGLRCPILRIANGQQLIDRRVFGGTLGEHVRQPRERGRVAGVVGDAS